MGHVQDMSGTGATKVSFRQSLDCFSCTVDSVLKTVELGGGYQALTHQKPETSARAKVFLDLARGQQSDVNDCH